MTPPDDQPSLPDAVVACETCDTVFRVHPAAEGRAMRDACPACGGPPGVFLFDVVLPPAADEPAAEPEPTPEPAPADHPGDATVREKEPAGSPSAEPPPEQAADETPVDPQPSAGPGEAGESSAEVPVQGGREEEMAAHPSSLDKPVSA